MTTRKHKNTLIPKELFITGKEMIDTLLIFNKRHGVTSFAKWLGVSSVTVRNYQNEDFIPTDWAVALAIHVGGVENYRVILNHIRGNNTNEPQPDAIVKTTVQDDVRETDRIKTATTASKGRNNRSKERSIPKLGGKQKLQVSNPV